MSDATKKFLKDLAERAGKTFVQGYLAFWLLTSGLGDTPAEVPTASGFDTLFTMDNVKAGAVALALSVASSVLTKRVGPDSTSASMVVATSDPTLPGA
jgi:hypothetical protein